MNHSLTTLSVLLLFPCALLIASDQPTHGHIFNSIVGANSEPELFSAVNLNSYELLTVGVQVSAKDALQKVVFSPIKAIQTDCDNFIWRELRVNIAQKSGISTFGIGLGYDDSSPFSKRGGNIIDGLNFDAAGKYPIRDSAEPNYSYDARKSEYYSILDSIYATGYESMLRNSIKLSLGYNISLFEVIAGDQVDLDNDGVIDNFHIVESHNLSVGFTYVVSSKTAFSVNSHFSSKLANPKQTEKRVDYLGGSISFATRLLVLDPKYRVSPEYKKSLFIPSLVFGASVEYQRAISNANLAKDGIANALVLTPFFEFKINPKNQFRIGIPLKRLSGSKDEISFGPIIQWNLQLSRIE